ncbi:MAG: methyltransferase [Streptomycetaceae bacterium]|nr:methyltransferase [Streptomycetaceae bacterium]
MLGDKARGGEPVGGDSSGGDSGAGKSGGGNSSADWDAFDPAAYSALNYATLRADDAQLLSRAAEFFAAADIAEDAHGLDVGPGSNLYPALTLLPFCRSVTMWEYSTSNAAWLRAQVQSYDPMWDAYWAVLARNPAHARIRDPRAALAERAAVAQGSLFAMPRRLWDVGTMFFVAESMTTRFTEFEAAVGRFVDALRPGAPFAAAFVENSEGYDVGSRRFPAVRVGVEEVRAVLADRTAALTVDRVGLVDVPWREGYTGMVFATGRAGAGACDSASACARQSGSSRA